MTWVFTYTDCEGNTHDWNYVYTIDIPDFAANLPAPGASTVNCPANATQPTPPVIKDFCGNDITATLKTTPAAIACAGTMTWVFTYTDCEGNAHDWNYVYTIDIPDFTVNLPAPGASTVNCPANALVQPGPPAINDACGTPTPATPKTTP